MSATLDQLAREVQARFPVLAGARLLALGAHGGFSGARLWRAGPAYLRTWPLGQSPEPLRWIHARQIQALRAGLSFVPGLHRTHAGDTIVSHGGRLWEAGVWLPGAADFHAIPTIERQAVAGASLAQLHRAWAGETTAPLAPIPGILRRRHLLHVVWDYLEMREVPGPIDATSAILRRALDLLHRWLPQVPGWLDRWATRALPLQPCLVDPWHDHLLFTGDRLTGLVDYGAAQLDHPAVDVARMLGSLLGEADWSQALQGYRRERRFTESEEELAHRLDRSGVVLSLGHWLGRLPLTGGDESARGVMRLTELVERIERW